MTLVPTHTTPVPSPNFQTRWSDHLASVRLSKCRNYWVQSLKNVFNTFFNVCVCVGGCSWGLDAMPLPTRPQHCCDPASLIHVSKVHPNALYEWVFTLWDLSYCKYSPNWEKFTTILPWVVRVMDKKISARSFSRRFSHMQGTICEWNVEKLEGGGS